MSATRDQAEHLRRQQAADYCEPDWKRKPATATERQAAAMLADAENTETDDGTDEHDATSHPATGPDTSRERSKGTTATERQAAVILDRSE